MSSTLRRKRPQPGRSRPRLENLETRGLLSVSPFPSLTTPPSVTSSVLAPTIPSNELGVIQTDPASGSVLTQSPATITVKFNVPFDPFTLGIDFDIDQVAPDGTATPIDNDFSAISEPFNLTAPTDTLTLTINPVLSPGHYRLMLLGISTLMGANGEPLANNGVDEGVADFTIEQPGVTLADATNLGTPGATPTVVQGSLNFQIDPTAVSLYKITLPAGHFWCLGAEVSATRDGGTLQSGLSLFDSQGNPIATSTIGMPDFPLDPYLFAGLKPGTYYIGVSDAKNLPGLGGYNPVTGDPGIASQDPVGGPFRLHLIANPADTPAQLVGMQFHWADPASQTPTGMTLAFSSSLSLQSFATLSQGGLFHGVELVDQSGKVWTMTPVQFQHGTTEVTFLFDDHLPAGTYRVRIPSSGGITDLAGLTPVAPGQPAGVLGSFTVPPSNPHHNPNDLGALTQSVHSGIPLSATVTPGSAVTYRFVVQLQDRYSFQTSSTGGRLAVLLIGPSGVITWDPSAGGSHLQDLAPGVYYLEFIDTGHQPATFQTILSEPASSWDSFWDNGLGQQPALNLALATPGAFDSSEGAASTTVFGPNPLTTAPSSGPSNPTQGSTTTSGPTPVFTSAGGVPSGPAGLILTLGNTPVGRPSPDADHVSVVGPGVESGTTALAFGGLGVPQGINYGVRSPGDSSEGEQPAADPDTDDEFEPVNGALTIPLRPTAPRADDRVLAESEWPSRVGDILARWFTPTPASEPTELYASDEPPPALRAERIVMHRDDEPGPRVERVEQAGFGMPISVGVAVVVALRARQPVRRWLHQSRTKARATQGTAVRPAHTRF